MFVYHLNELFQITIHWEPNLCQHAGIYVITPPQVYNPKASPGIALENASTEALKPKSMPALREHCALPSTKNVKNGNL
ncbi:(4Fe-4S)-binding protein [Cyclobacterium jeungdonense]|uniref:(4Fe-4S)-binding protein n=1 Tax=Cyclobacterium jeungdonense TaxID=708087 RepID=UPI00339063F0